MKKRNALLDGLKEVDPRKLILYILLFCLASVLLGTVLRFVLENLNAVIAVAPWHSSPAMLTEWITWLLGIVICAVCLVLYALGGGFQRIGRMGRSLLGGSVNKNIM